MPQQNSQESRSFALKTFLFSAEGKMSTFAVPYMQPLHVERARGFIIKMLWSSERILWWSSLSLSLSRLLAGEVVCACAIDFNSTLIITGEGWKSTLSVCVWARERTARLTLVSPGGTLSLFLVSQKLMHKNKMREKQKRVGVSQCRVSLLVRLSKALLRSWG